MTPYYGKYRGTVAANVDPNGQGRVQISCPAVLGSGRLSWAMPCVPYAGKNVGEFAVPPVGANVWIEFEGGDIDYPIVAGCFWGQNEAPAKPGLAATKIWQTDCVMLKLDDTPGKGGLTIEVKPPAVSAPLTLKFSSQGIELANGAAKIKLTPASVSINDGALEVI